MSFLFVVFYDIAAEILNIFLRSVSACCLERAGRPAGESLFSAESYQTLHSL